MATTKELLLHWYKCYGKEIVPEHEMDLFKAIMEKYGEDKIMEFAIYSYICDDGSPIALSLGIKNNVTDQMIELLPNIAEMEKKDQEIYCMCKKAFIEELNRTYQ